MNKYLCCCTALLGLGLLVTAPAAKAQAAFDFSSIDTLIEDNRLTDAANRYASLILSFFPERATRLGYSSANSRLNDRSAQTEADALNALRAVQETVNEIKPAQLSQANQTDLQLLQAALADDMWRLQQNRLENDPLYYAQALDAVYDVMLKKMTSSAQQKADLTARIGALPQVARQAQQNLVQPPSYLAELAMEKAYYAYLAFDEVTDFLLQGVEDDVSIAQTKQNARQAKQAIKQMFDLFKQFSQQDSPLDFRLGEDAYRTVLTNRYQLTQKPKKLAKRLEKNFRSAQEALARALEPFALETADEEVTVVDDLNTDPTVQSLPQEPQKKAKKGKFVPPTAQDFYKAARRMPAVPASRNWTAAFAQDAQSLADTLIQAGTLPAANLSFSVKPLPGFYAYTRAYLFVPPFGNQYAPTTDLFLRLPAGNTLARQEQLQRDFNTPTRKLLISGELVPGRYYQAVSGSQLSAIRRLYPSAATANGWSAYAQQLAAQSGYMATDEERLFLAWAQYLRAAAALVDVRLQTKQYSYTDAMHFLTEENGFDQKDAESLLKSVSAQPGEAAGYVYGLDSLKETRDYFAKKWGKQFTPAYFYKLLMQAGNVPPDRLKEEILRLDKKAKQQAQPNELF